MNVTNWHIDALIKKYNEKTGKNVEYINVEDIFSSELIVEVFSKFENEDNYLLIESVVYGEEKLHRYILKNNFEMLILKEKPSMEVIE